MPLTIECPRCKGRFRADDYEVGARVPCGACGQTIQIPPPDAATVPSPREEDPSEGRAGTRRRSRGTSRIRRGKGKKSVSRIGGRIAPRKSNSALIMVLSLLGLAVLILVVVLVNTAPPPAPPENTPPKKQVAAAPPPVVPLPGIPSPAPAPAPDAGAPKPEAPKPPSFSRDPDRADWSKIMRYLRAGGAFDDPNRPEGAAFASVKSMGKGAYPHLVKVIGDPDMGLARAAVVVLNELTGRTSPLPNETTRDGVKADWEKWLSENP